MTALTAALMIKRNPANPYCPTNTRAANDAMPTLYSLMASVAGFAPVAKVSLRNDLEHLESEVHRLVEWTIATSSPADRAMQHLTVSGR